MAKYPIGTKYWKRGKLRVECTVTDILTTTNHKGEVVWQCYVATHQLLGQTVEDRSVTDTTIGMGGIISIPTKG